MDDVIEAAQSVFAAQEARKALLHSRFLKDITEAKGYEEQIKRIQAEMFDLQQYEGMDEAMWSEEGLKEALDINSRMEKYEGLQRKVHTDMDIIMKRWEAMQQGKIDIIDFMKSNSKKK